MTLIVSCIQITVTLYLSNTGDCVVQFLLFGLFSFLDPFLDQMSEFPSPFSQFVFVHFCATNLQNTNGLFLDHVVHFVTNDLLRCRRSADKEDLQMLKSGT